MCARIYVVYRFMCILQNFFLFFFLSFNKIVLSFLQFMENPSPPRQKPHIQIPPFFFQIPCRVVYVYVVHRVPANPVCICVYIYIYRVEYIIKWIEI